MGTLKERDPAQRSTGKARNRILWIYDNHTCSIEAPKEAPSCIVCFVASTFRLARLCMQMKCRRVDEGFSNSMNTEQLGTYPWSRLNRLNAKAKGACPDLFGYGSRKTLLSAYPHKLLKERNHTWPRPDNNPATEWLRRN